MSTNVSLVESAKKAAAYKAVDDHLSPSYRYVGVGSGSTVIYVVEAIAAKGPQFWAKMSFIPTGSQSRGLIRNAGLTLCPLADRPAGANGAPVALDVAFDGADEVDEELNCIKGGGACLLQEKMVVIRAKKFVVVADYRKLSRNLGTQWKAGIPIEVVPASATDILQDLKDLGSPGATVRSGLPSKAGECVTDNGNWIIDAPFPPLLLSKDGSKGAEADAQSGSWEVDALARSLKGLVGVVEVGLFHGVDGVQAERLGKGQAQKPVAAYFGMANGEAEIRTAAG